MDTFQPNAKSRRFLATIYRIWMMRHVTVPEEVSRALASELAANGKGGRSRRDVRNSARRATGAPGKSTKVSESPRRAKTAEPAKPKYIPVVAIVNGRTSRTTLVPAGDGSYRMQINTALRKAAHADTGDVISVEVRLDRQSRELAVPGDLCAALEEHRKAREAFKAFTTAQRRQFIQWFDSAKAPETRLRRLTRAIDVLLEHAILSLPRRPTKRPTQ